MRGIKLKVNSLVDEEVHVVMMSIYPDVIQQAAEEIDSPLNRQGAQRKFSVHEPTVKQLIVNYALETDGL